MQFCEGVLLIFILKKKQQQEIKEENQMREREFEIARQLEKEEQLQYEQHQTLERQANSWEMANKIRAYIKAVENKACLKGKLICENSKFISWKNWANEYADQIDPINSDMLF